MPARGPRGEVISRGPTGAARLTSPAPSPVPSRGTRVEIVPRDREGLLGIEDDASRPSWRALIDAQEGRDRSADARGDTGRPRGPSEIPDGARQLGAPGPLTPALSPGGGGQKWPEGSRGNGTDGGSVTGQGGPDGVPVGRAERALEVVVACGPKGVTVHPGGYRLTTAVLKAEEGRLASTVRTIVAARRAAEPGVSWRPGLRFLVEPGGQATYWSARRQMLWAGVDWPVALQVAEVDAVRTLKWERW
jgi:hypothetical protein